MRQNRVIRREVPVLMIFLHAVVSLWPHESFDKRHEHREDLFKNNEEWRETGDSIIIPNCLSVVNILLFFQLVTRPSFSMQLM